MTLSSTDNRKEYAGNGVTTAFSFPYYFLEEADLIVILRVDATGVETVQTLTTHYTVTGEGEQAGGTVTMLAAPASGRTLIIYRDPTQTQDLDLVENDPLPVEELEMRLDKLTMLAQRLKDVDQRTVRLTEGFSSSFDTTLPALLEAGAVLVINDAGDGFDTGPTVEEIEDAAEEAAAAAASADAAAASETAAAASESAAASSASAAAASALTAAAAVNSVAFRDVTFLTFADSPYTLTTNDRGKLFAIDTSGGAFAFNLIAIAGLDLTSAFMFGIKKTTGDGNSITVTRASTDTIDGATTKVLGVASGGAVFVPDTDPSPDTWTTTEFGASAGNLTVDRFSGDGSDVTFTLSVDPGSENNTAVYVEGVYQQKDTYSVSGTTLTFSTAPPAGTDNIEVISGTTLSVGTPSDGTVSRAKLDAGTLSANQVIGINSGNTALEGKTLTEGYGVGIDHAANAVTFSNEMQVACVKEVQTSGTEGGTFTQGAWQTRTLNTLENPFSASWISLSSNQFTLQAGTYLIEADAPCYACGRVQAKVYNVTDTADAILGGSNGAGSTNGISYLSRVFGVVTVASAKAFELRHYCSTTSTTQGFGIAGSTGTSEVYSQVKITRLR